MRRRFLISLIALALLVLALLGWTAERIRWVVKGSRRSQLAPAG